MDMDRPVSTVDKDGLSMLSCIDGSTAVVVVVVVVVVVTSLLVVVLVPVASFLFLTVFGHCELGGTGDVIGED